MSQETSSQPAVAEAVPNKNDAEKYRRDQYLRERYNITGERYQRMLDRQDGGCCICNRKPDKGMPYLVVDHDHSCCPGQWSCGECVRGLLCHYCNYDLLGVICQESSIGTLHAMVILQNAQWYLWQYAETRRKRLLKQSQEAGAA